MRGDTFIDTQDKKIGKQRPSTHRCPMINTVKNASASTVMNISTVTCKRLEEDEVSGETP